MNERDVNLSVLTKRFMASILICAAGGVLCFLFVMRRMGENPLGMALSILYERLLIGVSIGFCGDIHLRPSLRGALLGVLFSLLWSIVFLCEGRILLAIIHCLFGIIYGVVADLVASSWSTRECRGAAGSSTQGSCQV